LPLRASTLSYFDGFRVRAVLLFIAVPFVPIMSTPRFKSHQAGAD